MADRAAFVEAIQASPKDDALRLVFADWLEEHGESVRAELIRAQCRPARGPGRRAAAAAAGRSLDALAAVWPPELATLGFDLLRRRFRRGCLHGLVFGVDEFDRLARPFEGREPLLDPALWAWSEPPKRLAACPYLRVVTDLAGSHLAPLLRSPHLGNVTAIRTREPTDLRLIVAAPAGFRLRRLTVEHWYDTRGRLKPGELGRLLASAPGLASLTTLDLACCPAAAADLRAMIGSPHLRPSLSLKVNVRHGSAIERDLALRFPGRRKGARQGSSEPG